MTNNFEYNVQEDLKSMDQRLTDMETKINSIDTKVTQVVDAIIGNPLTQTGGFIKELETLKQEVAILKTEVSKHEDFKKKIYWAFGIFAGFIGLIQFLLNLYNSIPKK